MYQKQAAPTISRRQLLASAAAGSAIAMSGGGAFAALSGVAVEESASEYWTKARIEQYLCKQIHEAKSIKLSKIIADEKIDIKVKNAAIKTATCPSCDVGISATV